MPARTSGINLLPKTEFEISFWGRFLRWAITTGRYILILVELVVIIAFLSRFKLDKDLADLSDSIAGKKAVLEAAYTTEQNFRFVQARLNAADNLLRSQTQVRTLAQALASYVPIDVSLSQVSIQPGQLTISATTPSQAGLGIFLARMTADPTWKSVDLVDVGTTADQQIAFTVIGKR